MNDLAELYLTTRELATLLRIKERKVYELVANGEVPCSRATGKLLFPRREVENWLSQRGTGFVTKSDHHRPDVLLGSHDPLLDWAVRESGCGLATFYDGSSDGLARFMMGEGVVAGLHLFDGESGAWNVNQVKEKCDQLDVVLVEFGWRDRGFLVAQDNPHKIEEIGDLLRIRLAARQSGAGAEMLLNYYLEQSKVNPEKVNRVLIARTETEAASAVTAGEADVAFGLRSVAKQHQLDFVPVLQERFDLLVDRRTWFEPHCQALLHFLRSEKFMEKSHLYTGYNCRELGIVHYNS